MSDQLFKCNECGKMTPLIQKNDTLPNDNDIERNYFECSNCQNKVTIFYSDEKLRKLIKKQQHTKDLVTHKSYEKIISNRMKELKNVYE